MRNVVLVTLAALAVIVGWILLRSGPSTPQPEGSSVVVRPKAPAPKRAAPTPSVPSSASPTAPAPAPIQLPPAGAASAGAMQFSGRVVDRDSRAGVANAEITLSRDGSTHMIVSGPGGRFEFVPPAPGSYQVAGVIAEGYAPFAPAYGQSPLALTARPDRAVSGVVIALAPRRTVKVTVVGPGHNPVDSARVQVFLPVAQLPDLDPESRSFTTDDQGQCHVAAPAGALVEAHHPNFASVAVWVMPADVRRGAILLRLGPLEDDRPTAKIAGRVVDERDRPVAEASVNMVLTGLPRIRTRTNWVTRTDAEGQFAFTALPPGTFSLSASAPGRVPARVADVPSGTADVFLRLSTEGGHIAGRVTDPTGAAVVSFVVVVSRRVGQVEERSMMTRSFIDPDGAYRLGPFAPGAYRVRAAAAGFAVSRPASADVVAGETETADLSLSEGGRLVGSVLNKGTEEPVGGARVELDGTLLPTGLPIAVGSGATTEPTGRFVLSGIPDGLFSVTTHAPGFNTRITSGLRAVDGQQVGPVEIRLSPVADGETPTFELAGIGAALSPRGDVVLIGDVMPGGGAAEVGVLPGDRIIAIDGRPVGELDFHGVIQLIRGPVGSTVLLKMLTESDAEKVLVVPRRSIRG